MADDQLHRVQRTHHQSDWLPSIGPELLSFLNHAAPREAHETLRESTVEILGSGVSPEAQSGSETGLVVGYVQSGKTMSFEAAAALARDNGFGVVIVIAGTSRPLLEQSSSRIRKDLQLDNEQMPRRWIQLTDPNTQELQFIRNAIDNIRDPHTPLALKQTLLVTVLKHHTRLNGLISVLSSVDLSGIATLVIDDEADQASLNTEVSDGEESTTYSRIKELRQHLPNHTYLQYTATPQAPLLISIADELSPSFVHVLEPGADYVGGREFFGPNRHLVRIIPAQDLFSADTAPSEPPESLLEALRVFLVGVAVGVASDNVQGTRSMLVHPSYRTVLHEQYSFWVRSAVDEYSRILSLPNSDLDRRGLVDYFKRAYEDLAQTASSELPGFDAALEVLPAAIRNTRILEVNTREGPTPIVEWRNAYAWILVGGQAMDRGFTVEGLTVTYMPRGLGIGNADTVQQRARFFGYKRDYLGLCRVYLEENTRAAYEAYVDHEEDIRSQLKDVQLSGQSLDAWKRAFLLEPALRPCRQQVLEHDYRQGRFGDTWVTPRLILPSMDVLQMNRAIVDEFLDQLDLEIDKGHPDRTPTQTHAVADAVPLGEVYEELLIAIRLTGSHDSYRNTGMLLQLKNIIERDPLSRCSVFRMSPSVRRERSVTQFGEIKNLFQGEAPVNPRERRGDIYPGDRNIRNGENVTVQIHCLDVYLDDELQAENVPVVAVWIPSHHARGWLVQVQD